MFYKPAQCYFAGQFGFFLQRGILLGRIGIGPRYELRISFNSRYDRGDNASDVLNAFVRWGASEVCDAIVKEINDHRAIGVLVAEGVIEAVPQLDYELTKTWVICMVNMDSIARSFETIENVV